MVILQKRRAGAKLSATRSQTYLFISQHWRCRGGNYLPLPLKDDAKIRTFSSRYKCIFRPSLETLTGKGKEARKFFRASLQILQM